MWMSLSAVAAAKGVSKQAISKRVMAYVTKGLLQTRRVGREIQINLEDFERVASEVTDPAQQLRNAGTAPAPTADEKTSSEYSSQKARQAKYDADLSQLKLERESGRWVEAHKAQQAWGRELARLRGEIESFIVNRMAREVADELNLDWKVLAVLFREKYQGFCRTEAERAAATVAAPMTGDANGTSG
jgi:hypothetical protein